LPRIWPQSTKDEKNLAIHEDRTETCVRHSHEDLPPETRQDDSLHVAQGWPQQHLRDIEDGNGNLWIAPERISVINRHELMELPTIHRDLWR